MICSQTSGPNCPPHHRQVGGKQVQSENLFGFQNFKVVWRLTIHSARTERLRFCGMWLIRAPHPDSCERPSAKICIKINVEKLGRHFISCENQLQYPNRRYGSIVELTNIPANVSGYHQDHVVLNEILRDMLHKSESRSLVEKLYQLRLIRGVVSGYCKSCKIGL